MKISYPFPITDLHIRLQHGAFYGSCPAYTLEISGTGEVYYSGSLFVREMGIKTTKIPQEKVLSIFKKAIKIGFFDMKSEYTMEEEIVLDEAGNINLNHICSTDLPTVEVEIAIGKKKKKIIDYSGAPARLSKFGGFIDEVCNSAQWIKKGKS